MNNHENCILISSGKNWVEQAAVDQLRGVSRLPGMIRTVGLPDLHPGNTPVGMAALSRGRFYPHLIGNDIGCGMSLFSTQVRRKRFKMEKWVTRLNSIRELGDIPCDNPYEEECPIRDFGTIGSGNHFIEFQCLEQVYDESAAKAMGLLGENVLVLVHSGSRGYGQEILSRYNRPEGIEEDSIQAAAYLAAHDDALKWAGRNRLAAAGKLLDYLNTDSQLDILMESCHNYLEQTEDGWLHRKGSVSAKHGAVVIPGSRGSLTYVFRERIPEFPWIPFHTEPEENGRAASVKAGLTANMTGIPYAVLSSKASWYAMTRICCLRRRRRHIRMWNRSSHPFRNSD